MPIMTKVTQSKIVRMSKFKIAREWGAYNIYVYPVRFEMNDSRVEATET